MMVAVPCEASPNGRHQLTFVFDQRGLVSAHATCASRAELRSAERLGSNTCKILLAKTCRALQDNGSRLQHFLDQTKCFGPTLKAALRAETIAQVRNSRDQSRASRSQHTAKAMQERDPILRRVALLNQYVAPLLTYRFPGSGPEFRHMTPDGVHAIVLTMFGGGRMLLAERIAPKHRGWAPVPGATVDKLVDKPSVTICPVCKTGKLSKVHREGAKHKHKMDEFLASVQHVLDNPQLVRRAILRSGGTL
jgi:hypothetical protein